MEKMHVLSTRRFSEYRVLGSLFFMACLAQATHAQEGFQALFNGKDLSGWEIVVADGSDIKGEDIFHVEDGAIHVYANAEAGSEQPFAGIYTSKSYSHYHLKLEFKWGEAKFEPRANLVRDAGIILHVFKEPRIWPTGVEYQIQEGDTGDIWVIGQTRVSSYVHPIAYNFDRSGDLITRGAGLGPSRFTRGYSWEQAGWNLAEVIVRGDHAVFKINGHTVNEAVHMRYRDDPNNDWTWYPLNKGRIFLQAEGAELFYRNIMIKELEEE